MQLNSSLEQLSLGEASLEAGAKAVNQILVDMDARRAEQLYGALRSWVWKTLESRRRDEDISGWMDVIAKFADELDDHLAKKVEGWLELLHMSAMSARVEERREPLAGKHARRVLFILRAKKRAVSKQSLMELTKLKPSNLTQMMAPLIDSGLVERSIRGREVEYRLTRKGLKAIDMVEPIFEAPPMRPVSKEMAIGVLVKGKVEDYTHHVKGGSPVYVMKTHMSEALETEQQPVLPPSRYALADKSQYHNAAADPRILVGAD